MKTKMVVLVMFLGMLFIGATNVNAGCGSWQITGASGSFCSEFMCGTSGGFYATQQKVYHKRNCVSGGNKTWTETKTTRKQLGCCRR